MLIPFNRVSVVHNEKRYVDNAIDSGLLCGGGDFEALCTEWFTNNLGVSNTLMTPSCTHALKIMVISMGINGGDEVIMTSDII